MTMAYFKGRKKGESATNDRITGRNCHPPAAIPLSDDENSSAGGDSSEESGGFGVILVNKYQNQQGWVEGDIQRTKGNQRGNVQGRATDYRGSSAKNNDIKYKSIDRSLAKTYIGGFCIPDKYEAMIPTGQSVSEWFEQRTGVHLCCAGSSLSHTTTDATTKPIDNGIDNNNNNVEAAFLLSDPENLQRYSDRSLLTEVSILTDASLMDLILNEEDENIIEKEMSPTERKTINHSKELPAFCKSKRSSDRVDLLVEEAILKLKNKLQQRKRNQYLHHRLPQAVVPHNCHETKETKSNKKKNKTKPKLPLLSRHTQRPTWTKNISSSSFGSVFKKKKNKRSVWRK